VIFTVAEKYVANWFERDMPTKADARATSGLPEKQIGRSRGPRSRFQNLIGRSKALPDIKWVLSYPVQGDRVDPMAAQAPIHESHPETVKRLKRADGHLKGIIEMIEAGRSCLEVAQQLQAVEKAVAQAKRTLIQDHLDHCLEDVVGSRPRERRQSIDEFKEIAKYL
jgi:DNA-binding FrmR family transcriptional regulator